MNKTKFVTVMLMISVITSVCLGQSYWNKTYNGIVSGDPIQTIPLQDGSTLILGSAFWLLKINSFGDTLWTKTFGPIVPTQILLQPDSSIILSGSTWETDHYQIWLIKCNSTGKTLWTKSYRGCPVLLTQSDTSVLISGTLKTYIYFLKINSSGDSLWAKTYGGYTNYTPTQQMLLPDGCTLILGYGQPYAARGFTCLLIKINSSGDTLWSKTYGENEISNSLIRTLDGNFIISGSKSPTDSFVIFIHKIKPNGDTIWTKSFKEYFFSVMYPTSNGNFNIGLFGSNSISFLTIINDQYANKNTPFHFKIPVSGDSLGTIYFPLKVPSGMTTSPGGTISWTPKTDSVYIDHVEYLVADDFGKKDTLTFNIFVNSSTKSTALKAIPNFAANKNQTFNITQISSSQIKFSVPSGALSIDIYDMRGRQIQHLASSGNFALWNKSNVSGTPVPTGTYFARIANDNRSKGREFLIVK